MLGVEIEFGNHWILSDTSSYRLRNAKNPARTQGFFQFQWWWGGTLRQTYVTQRLRTAANSCGKVRNPAPTANNPTSSARPGSPAKYIRQAASSIPICGIEPASASTHPTFDQAVTNRSRNAHQSEAHSRSSSWVAAQKSSKRASLASSLVA